jgi:enoyl-[acyl-carrier protein] reductase I
VYSLKELARALRPLLERSNGGASLLGVTVMDRALLHSYAWMAVVKAAFDALVKQLAAQLGPGGTRVNLLACGPVKTNAASAIRGLDRLVADYRERAPLGWDERDFAAIAGPAGFMLSDLSRRITGEIVHVDGGRHVVL